MKQVELQGRIDKATREISNSYGKALKAVEELKRKIGELELSISSKGCTKTGEDMNQLNSALDSLDSLTDSLILESRKAWEQYSSVERDCRITTCEPAELKGLRDLCRKTEEFAADLLCYSLARFKRKGALDSLSQ